MVIDDAMKEELVLRFKSLLSYENLNDKHREEIKENNKSAKETIKALGIVFGDIGTSPIYTLTVIFALVHATQDNIIGVLSLIVWTLIMLVSVQYAWLAMSFRLGSRCSKFDLSARGDGFSCTGSMRRTGR